MYDEPPMEFDPNQSIAEIINDLKNIINSLEDDEDQFGLITHIHDFKYTYTLTIVLKRDKSFDA